jgi:hypothetical protein
MVSVGLMHKAGWTVEVVRPRTVPKLLQPTHVIRWIQIVPSRCIDNAERPSLAAAYQATPDSRWED